MQTRAARAVSTPALMQVPIGDTHPLACKMNDAVLVLVVAVEALLQAASSARALPSIMTTTQWILTKTATAERV